MMLDPFEEWICRHDHFNVAQSALTAEVDRVLAGGAPFMFMLLGMSRAGKSELLKDVKAEKAIHKSQSGHSRVLYIPMPTVLANDALASRIILTILGTADVKGNLRDTARMLLKDSGTDVVLLDETNHLSEAFRSRAAQSKENRGHGDWIKEIFELSGISIAMSGLPHSVSILMDNEQLEGRALRPVHLHPYDWSVPAEQAIFDAVVLGFVTQMKLSGWSIDVDSVLVTRAAYVCSGGLVGKVRDIFHSAFELGGKTNRLEPRLLARAYIRKFPDLGIGNPFEMTTLTDELLNAAHRRTLARGQAPDYQEKSTRKGGK
jgi:hypothetical protein